MFQWGGKVIDIPYTQGISSSMLNQRLKEIGTTPEIRLKRLRRLIAAKPIGRIRKSFWLNRPHCQECVWR